MNIEDLARPEIREQPVYEAGKPISHVAREFGLDPDSVLKLASNENPLGSSPKAIAAARDALRSANLYPDSACYDLTRKLAALWNLSPAQFVCGNGSNEVIELLTRAFLRPGDEVVMGEYAFIVYRLLARMAGAKLVTAPMTKDFAHDLGAMREAVNERTKIVFFTHPNNPTGGVNDTADILAFARGLPEHVILCFDEAYAEFMDSPPDLRPLIAEGRPVLCCRTFSKIYGCAGMRVGYGYGPEGLVGLMHRARQPFNVNAISQAAALAALDDTEFVEKTRRVNREGLDQLAKGLAGLGFETVPSQANFVLFKVGAFATDMAGYLQSKGVIVRGMVPYKLPEYLRVTVGTQAQNERFLKTFADGLRAVGSPPKR